MITQVIMKRELFGGEISQQSKTQFFSATDLERIGNVWRSQNNLPAFKMNKWFTNKSTQEFISMLENKYEVVKVNSRGKNQHTWIHPLLFIDMALAISPELKLEVYEWIFDHLLKYRNDSGNSYKEMSSALYEIYSNKKEFPKFIIKVADYIKDKIGVTDWQKATQEQLEQRDKIHNAIKLFCRVMTNPKEAVRLGVYEYTTMKLKK